MLFCACKGYSNFVLDFSEDLKHCSVSGSEITIKGHLLKLIEQEVSCLMLTKQHKLIDQCMGASIASKGFRRIFEMQLGRYILLLQGAHVTV